MTVVAIVRRINVIVSSSYKVVMVDVWGWINLVIITINILWCRDWRGS